MRQPCKTARGGRVAALREEVNMQQFCQSSRAKTDACLSKKLPPGQIFLMAAPFLEAARHGACASRRGCIRSAHHYSFITVSFKLRIRLVTLVYAASSLTSRLVSRG